MAKDKEVDFEGAKPAPEQTIIDHFTVDIDVGKLEYKEITPELLAEFHKVKERLEALEQIKEMLRANIIKCMGRSESHTVQGWVVFLKKETRKGTVDYKRLLQDKEITDDILAQYRKPDTEYQKIEVRRLG